jgi:drug/metabolite transporter (DMT)-like permease
VERSQLSPDSVPTAGATTVDGATPEPARPGARAGGTAGAYVAVAVAATLWGTWTLFLRPAGLDPRWNSPLVFAAMTLFGAPLLLRARARLDLAGAPRGRRDWLWLGLLGLADAANVWLFFGALARTTVAVAVLSHYLAPALVALVAPPVARTPPQRGALPRALLATAGLCLVLEPWRLAKLEPRHLLGALFGAASAGFYALNVCIAKRLAPRFSAEEQLVYHSAISLALLLLVAPWSAVPEARGAALVFLAGALIGVTAAVLFVRGVARIPAEHAAVLTFLEPLTAVLVGALAFGERLGPLAWVGGAVVIGTGVAASRAKG